MKLFIWVDPYPVSYGSSMLLAVADNVDHAREIAKRGMPCSFGTPKCPTDGEWDTTTLGEPHRVLDLPCAEWHEWSE